MQRVARYRLITLGRLALIGPEGAVEESLSKRRRKLAVLAVMAMERKPVPRDMLLEMFWGDQPEERARHSLSDALSHLRRVLGRDAIAVSRAEVSLSDRAALAVDALLFREAATAGEHVRAAELYGGPFLGSVYVDGASSFEHWTDRHRAALHTLFLRTCREVCGRAVASGDYTAAAAIAERWLVEEPLSTEAFRRRLESLAAAAGTDSLIVAAREYATHASRLRREFGVELPAELISLGEEITRRAAPPAARELVTQPHEQRAQPTQTVEPDRDAADLPASSSAQYRRKRRSWWMSHWALLAATAVAIALVLVRLMPPARSASADPAPDRVAILPFDVHGGGEIAYLREGMVDLLGTSLDGLGRLTTSDARAVLSATSNADSTIDVETARTIARRVGAGRFLLGSVIAAGGRIRMTAALYGSADGTPESRAEVDGTPEELFTLVDRLTSQIVAGTQAAPAEQLGRTAALTTPSLTALKAYLAGEQHFRRAQYALALEDYQRAVASDSTFPLAHYRLSLTTNWLAGSWDSIFVSSSRAVRFDARLSPRARLVVEAHDAWRRGANDEAERLYRTLTTAHPDDVEGWYQLGEVLFHGNPLRGRSLLESRAPFERALALEPGHTGAMAHLVRVAAIEGRVAARDSLSAQLMKIDSTWAAQQVAIRAFASNDPRALSSALETLRHAADLTVWVAAERVAVVGGDLATTEDILRVLAEPRRTKDFQLLARLLLADLEAARGRWSAARDWLNRAAELDSTVALERHALLALHPFLHPPREELAAVRARLERQTGPGTQTTFPNHQVFNSLHPILRDYLVGMLALRLGDTAQAERAGTRLERSNMTGESGAVARGLGLSLRGHLAAARGDAREAIDLFERGRLVANEGFLDSTIGSQALERWVRAEELYKLGNDTEARRWYATLTETSLSHQLYRAPAAMRIAEIEARQGHAHEAAESYQRLLTTWRDCDPALRPSVDSARAQLASLGVKPLGGDR